MVIRRLSAGFELGLSYLGQATNLIVGAAMLPLILIFLTDNEFVIWSVFTTIAGVSLQAEIAVQATLSRRIAAAGASDPRAFVPSYFVARKVYHRFSLLALLFLGTVGAGYLVLARPGNQVPLAEWFVYTLAFFANYFLAVNPAFLIARERTAALNINHMTSRLLNFFLLVILFQLQFRLWALVISFAVSVATSITLNYRAARKTIALDQLVSTGEPDKPIEIATGQQLVLYAVFLVLSFWAYRLLLLVDVAVVRQVSQSASLALALQLFSLAAVFSLVPITMRVAPLVRHLQNDPIRARIEFARLHLLCLGGIVACTMAFLILGVLPLEGFGISVSWPEPFLIIALGMAFSIEVTLQAIASVFVTQRHLGFVRHYTRSIFIALVLGVGTQLAGSPPYVSVLVMALVQMSVALPLMWRALSDRIGIESSDYARSIRSIGS